MSAMKLFLAIVAVAFAIVVYFVVKPVTYGPIKPLEEKWWGDGDRKDESEEITPFTVPFSESAYSEVLSKLRNTRYFDSVEEVGWTYGTRPDFMKKVVDYWLNKFSWKNQVDYINKYEHFKTNIDGISLHFLLIKPSNVQPETKVLPMLLLHGWPGSFFEFHKAIPKLVAERDGYAFELVIPSLPGFGYSSAARKSGLGPDYVGLIMKKLMHRLGHKKFYVQGGDFGSEVSRMIARIFPEYAITTKPDTVGFALNDSPSGLASYILEKFVYCLNDSRCQNRDILNCMEDRITLDELLTNIMIYWDTSSMPSAVRFYKETVNSENNMLLSYPVLVPAGFASFPHEIMPPPKSWLEAISPNLVSFTVMEKGGHFAAFEEPDAFSEDLRNFVYKVEALPS